MTSYAQKLLDPRWQKRRLDILNARNWECETCESTEKTLHVHHRIYRKGAQPWEYGDNDLQVLCKDCHLNVSELKKRLDEALARIEDDEIERLIGYCEAILLFRFDHEFVESISISSIAYAQGVSDAVAGHPLGDYEIADRKDDRILDHDELVEIWRERRDAILMNGAPKK